MKSLELLVIGVYLIRMTKLLKPIFRLSDWGLKAICAAVYFTLKLPCEGRMIKEVIASALFSQTHPQPLRCTLAVIAFNKPVNIALRSIASIPAFDSPIPSLQ